MAVKKKLETPPLTVSLSMPGMTPLLRAGVGGLAAGLRHIAEEEGLKWKDGVVVPLGPGEAVVTNHQIELRWGKSAEKTLEALFDNSFKLTKNGVIDLPGTRIKELDLTVSAALQDALKRTFLQHGKTTTKKGAAKLTSFEIDDQKYTVNFQPYSDYAHRKEGAAAVLEALTRGSVNLAGWAYPGAAVRHTAFSSATGVAYSAPIALAALFALVGCLSLQTPGRGGVLLALVPRALIRFARLRPLLTPDKFRDVTVSGLSDAVVTARVLLRSKDAAGDESVSEVVALLLRATPWASQQKSRIAVISNRGIGPRELEAFSTAIRLLPTELVALKNAKKGEESFFASPSVFREFVANNLARGKKWFDGFATARADGERFIHYYRQSDNKGALMARERKGIEVMSESLDEAELALVRSVHVAFKQRLGAISEETEAKVAREKRWGNEREKWRLAFAQSKTQEQIRAALADLWSRAGSNKELAENWPKVLPLLREDSWQAARDLALVALASYRGAPKDDSNASPSTID